MELGTRGTGRTIKLLVEGNSSMWTEIIMMDSGRMIRRTGMEFTFIPTDPGIRAIGKMTTKMDMEKSSGLMEAHIMENTKRAKSTVRGFIDGRTQATTKANGLTTKSMGKAFTTGWTEESTKGTGSIIRCMGKESILGPTAENTTVNTKRIRSTVSGHTHGPTVRNTSGNGGTAKGMVEVLFN